MITRHFTYLLFLFSYAESFLKQHEWVVLLNKWENEGEAEMIKCLTMDFPNDLRHAAHWEPLIVLLLDLLKNINLENWTYS